MKKKILYNIITSFILEVVTVVCAFILPRMIITGFGSEYNGIVSSVTQFISVITLLRGGVGGVTRAALYKPLAENDVVKINAILNTTERFMRKIAGIFAVFLVVLAAVYPFCVSAEFDWLYTFSLVLILGISTLSQYYFGITYQFLLAADQKSYVYHIIQTAATIINTVFSVCLINLGVEFRLMKLISSIVFASTPIVMYWYVHKKYTIVKSVPCDNSYIQQRWDAFMHQAAAFVHNNTDVMLLTLLTNLYQVSVYQVYFMVVNGIRQFVTVFLSGFEATTGKLLAMKDRKQLLSFFDVYEWGIHTLSTCVFVTAAILIVPFVQVYTSGITDANYIQPMLGYWLCLGFFFFSIRLPYQSTVEAAGKFKETRNGAFAEATINIVISIVFIILFGHVGAAIGTAVAVIFRTTQYVIYMSKHILFRSCFCAIKRFAVTVVNIVIIMVPYFAFDVFGVLHSHTTGYLSWLIEAVVIFSVVTFVTLTINITTYRSLSCNFVRFFLKRNKN